MFRRIFLSVLLLASAAGSLPAHAAISVFACEPEWAALAAEIGGPDVTVGSATTALQDVHQVQARPSLIARLRTADLAICTGAELEIGWLPVLLRQAANPAVQPGRPGFVEAAGAIALKEQPARLDRADGDVHAAGNPHIQTDPRNIRAVAELLIYRLSEVDPAHAAGYAARGRAFLARWDAAVAQWERRAAPLRGTPVMVGHRAWIYLADWLGLRQVQVIEPKPGVPPGPGYLAQLVADVPRLQPRMILLAAYEDARPARLVAEKTGLPVVTLPWTVGGSERAASLTALFDETIGLLLDGIGAKAAGG